MTDCFRPMGAAGRYCALLAISIAGLALADDPYAADRERMVRDQIESRGVRGNRLLRALRATPRHLFVPPAYQSIAYRDHPVPIGHRATISQPYIVAWMTELLNPSKTDRVLEIGTGSGYQAAILAQLAGRVYTIELVPELADSARRRLASLGYSNVTVRHGDGYKGWPEEAPFDRIILTASPPEVPPALLLQLAAKGRLIAPVGRELPQQLMVIEKNPRGELQPRSVGEVLFVPMRPGEH
jgi:protein-L-isoaspartate(D-aspartate) O-methyltransferase